MSETGLSLPHMRGQTKGLEGRLCTNVMGAVGTGLFSKSKYSTQSNTHGIVFFPAADRSTHHLQAEHPNNLDVHSLGIQIILQGTGK